MKLHNVSQKSLDWLLLRSGIPTASEMGSLVTAKWCIKDGEGPKTYLATKLAERWLGGPLAGGATIDMDFGNILEEEARPYAAMELNTAIEPMGFITDDAGKFGCSPDGIIQLGNDAIAGIEIKCPDAHTHVKYVLNGNVPDAYLPQVHASMLVTGAPFWWFLSYRRKFPHLLLKVMRDDAIIKTLETALAQFYDAFEHGFERMKQRYGGPPPAQQQTFESMADQAEEPARDLIP